MAAECGSTEWPKNAAAKGELACGARGRGMNPANPVDELVPLGQIVCLEGNFQRAIHLSQRAVEINLSIGCRDFAAAYCKNLCVFGIVENDSRRDGNYAGNTAGRRRPMRFPCYAEVLKISDPGIHRINVDPPVPVQSLDRKAVVRDSTKCVRQAGA